MITNIVVDYIATKFPLLIPSENLFAENAPINKCVYAKTTTTVKFQKMDSHFRRAYIKIYVKGYSINDGVLLCNQILTELESMKGEFSYTDNEQYLVLGCDIQDFPYNENIDGSNVIIGTISLNHYLY